jgi:hypothetical protein
MKTLAIFFALLVLSVLACSRPVPEPQSGGDAGTVVSSEMGVSLRLDRLVRVGLAGKSARSIWKDPRTPEQLAQLSCLDAKGVWQCKGIKQTRRLGASSGSVSTPPSWSVPFWAVDPQKAVSGACASDSNSCTSATCVSSGIGPCLTYGTIVQRWGTPCPQLAQVTQVEFMSGHTTDADPANLCAFSKAPAYLEVFAATPATCTATLSNVTAKNRATGQLLQAQAGSCFTGGDLMVVNTTHPAVAWTFQLISGSIYSLTEPANNNSYVSVDSWANGDTVQVGAATNINVRSLATQGSAIIPGFGFSMWVHDITLWAPHTGPKDGLSASGNGIIYMDEVAVQDGEFYAQGAAFTECDNCDFENGTELNLPGNIGAESAATEMWGLHRGGIGKLGNAAIGADIILGSQGSGTHYVSGAHIGSVYLASGATIVARGGDSEFVGNFGGNPTGSPIAWGPGVVQATGSSKFSYPPGQSASVFLNSGGLSFDTTTTGCAFDTSVDPAVWHCNRNLTAALLATSIAGGGFADCAISPHGARFCVP